MRNGWLVKWTWQRLLFTLAGGLMMVQGFIEKQYVGVFFGFYFLLMGVLGLGCASGSCQLPSSRYRENNMNKTDEKNV